jgi:adenylate cyclase
MIELEKRFLVKSLPPEVFSAPSKEVIDQYIPKDAAHAYLRVRRNGDCMVITKKKMSDESKNHFLEDTIVLTLDEWEVLSTLPSKVLHKTRYFVEWNGFVLEVGVFQGLLKGLVLVDVEFTTPEHMNAFVPPDWFLAEVDDEEFAGGWLCGKNISDLKTVFEKYEYTPL